MEIGIDMLSKAAEIFDTESASLVFIGGYDSRVYEIAGNGSGQPTLLRISMVREGSLPGLLDQYAFIDYLNSGGLSVSAPIPSRNGKLVETLPADKEGTLYAVVSMGKAPGRHVDVRNPEEFNHDLFRTWGQTMGKLHKLSKAYAGGSKIMGWQDEIAAMKGMCKDPEIMTRWDHIQGELDTLPQGPDSVGLTHNDMHPGNFFLSHGGITLFDFDVMSRHWYALDTAIALHSALWSRRPSEIGGFIPFFLDNFFQGYNLENTLGSGELARLHLFLSYRHTLLYTVDCVEPQGKALWKQEILDGRPFGIEKL